jgi:putative addiction module component (TIGR02574 family)
VREHVTDLLKKALTLPPEARAALAGSLLDSLEEDALDEGVEAAWGAEIARRVQELSLGRVSVLPWTEVRRRLTIP